MAAYPTSSGPMPSIVAIRWPVVSSRRCVQRTAFGAADVPDVNSSAHRTSRLTVHAAGRRPWSGVVVRPRRSRGRRPTTHPSTGRIVAVGEALGDEDAARAGPTPRRPLEQRLVAGLGDQELHVGVRDVASQVFAAPSVVQPHQRRPHQSRAAQREHVVRGVVEEHGDMGRAIGVEPGAVQRGEPLGFDEKLFVSPHLVAETKRRAILAALRRRRCV